MTTPEILTITGKILLLNTIFCPLIPAIKAKIDGFYLDVVIEKYVTGFLLFAFISVLLMILIGVFY